MSKSVERDSKATSVDVMIVGAGFAGLTAAEQLVDKGMSVRVVEGRDRVGGRSFTGEVAGVQVDYGATWVSPQHTAIRDLMTRMGCSTTSQFDEGDSVLWMDGQRSTYTGTLPEISPEALEDLGRIQTALEELLATIDVEAAWESPDAAKLDSISFAEWLDQQQAQRSTRALMTIVSKVQWGTIPEDVSLLHALRYIRAVGGLDHMLSVEGGEQQDRITETTHGIARRLADQLGDRVVVGTPVQRITQDDNGVTVSTDSEEIHAKYVIVTASPVHRADIKFDPPLPDKAEALTRTWELGTLSKAFIAYEKPFWRSSGLSGQALTDTGTVFITFDVSPDDNGPGILMAFCDPRVFDGFITEDRRRRVLEQLVELYGSQAGTPIDYVDHCWGVADEPFAPGGPNPAVGPYALTSYATALTEPHGRVHWAGVETAGEWAGCMNGAVLTGQRAAERVAQELTA